MLLLLIYVMTIQTYLTYFSRFHKVNVFSTIYVAYTLLTPAIINGISFCGPRAHFIFEIFHIYDL